MQASTQLTGSLASSYLSLTKAQQQYALTATQTANIELASDLKRLAQINALDLAKRRELATSLRAVYVSQGKTSAEIEDLLALRGLSIAQLQHAAATEKGVVANLKFTQSLKIMWQTNPAGLIMMAASILATVLIPTLSAVIKTSKELREEYEQEQNKLKELEDAYQANADRIAELVELKQKNDWSDANEKELQDLRDQNTELATQIEYRKRILALREGRTERAAEREWATKGVTYRTDDAGATWTYDLTDYTSELQAAWRARQNAYEEFYRTGNHQLVEQSEKEIQRILTQGNKLVDVYDELREWLPQATKDIWDPIIEGWQQLAVETGNDAPLIIQALDAVASSLFPKVSSHDVSHDTLISDLRVLKEQTESGTMSVKTYQKQLSSLLTMLQNAGLSSETLRTIQQLLSLSLTPNSLAQTVSRSSEATNRGSLAQQIEHWLGGKTYQELDEFNKFLEEFDITGVKTFTDLTAAFEKWKASIKDDVSIDKLATNFEGLSNLQDDLKALNQAFKDIADKDSLGVTYSTLSSIAEKFGDVDNIDLYINRLAAAGKNAEEVNSILADLAWQKLTNAENSEILASADESVISALLREAGVANSDEVAFKSLQLAMINLNKTGLNLSGQISALAELAAACGMAESEINSLRGTMTLDPEYAAQLHSMGINPIVNQELVKENLSYAIGDKIRSQFKLIGDGVGGGGGGGSTPEAYIAEIDKYREAIRKLNAVQAEREQIEHTISRTDDPRERISLEGQLIDTYREEQSALHVLNDLRRDTIRDGVKQLQDLGFVVEYNADANDLWIENLEYLNELQAGSVEETNELIKNTEDLIETITDLNDANQEGSDNWWELSESITDARVEINNLLNEIVERASQAVDAMQNVYETLHKAADEYAESGYITVDTLQSIISLGPQYMQYLLDENGQLVINEERIKAVIAARTEQLALESALTYVEALRIAQEDGNVTKLNELLFATEAATDAGWGLVYSNLAMLNLNSDQYDAALHNINTIRALADSASGSIGDITRDTQSSLKSILQYVMDMLKQQNADAVQALRDQVTAYKDIINKQKESLQLKKKENDYNKTINSKLKEIAKIQAQLDILSLDNSREATAKRAKLLEDLASLNEDLSETQADHELEVQEDALDKMADSYEKEKEEEIKILEDSLSSYQKLYDAAISYIESHWDTLYTELISWNTEYGNVLNSEITAAWEDCLAAAQRYGSFVEAMNATSGSGMNTIVGQTGNYSANTTEAANGGGFNPKVYKVKPDGKAPEGLNVGDYVVTGGGLYRITGTENGYQSIKVGEPFSTGNYDDLEAIYQDLKYKIEKQGLRYHTGGIAGGQSTIKQDEVMAILRKGEPVLGPAQEEGLYRLVDFIQRLQSRVNTAMQNPLARSFFNGSASSQALMASMGAAGGNTSVQFGDVYISGADENTLRQHTEINRKFVNEVLNVLNVRR